MSQIEQIAFHQGISDWWHFKSKCPVYWRGKPEEQAWREGVAYARNWNNG